MQPPLLLPPPWPPPLVPVLLPPLCWPRRSRPIVMMDVSHRRTVARPPWGLRRCKTLSVAPAALAAGRRRVCHRSHPQGSASNAHPPSGGKKLPLPLLLLLVSARPPLLVPVSDRNTTLRAKAGCCVPCWCDAAGFARCVADRALSPTRSNAPPPCVLAARWLPRERRRRRRHCCQGGWRRQASPRHRLSTREKHYGCCRSRRTWSPAMFCWTEWPAPTALQASERCAATCEVYQSCGPVLPSPTAR